MTNAYQPDEARPLDLNTADADALRDRCGIAITLARRIVEDREQNGPFVDPRDVGRVAGVGARTLQRITENVVVAAPTVRPGSLLPFRPVDPARLAPTVPPGGVRRSRRPRVRIATDIPVVAPRPLSADVLRAMPVTPTGWPDREPPRPVFEDAPVVRLAPASPRPAPAPSSPGGPITIVPGEDPDPSPATVPSVRLARRSLAEAPAAESAPASDAPSATTSVRPRTSAPPASVRVEAAAEPVASAPPPEPPAEVAASAPPSARPASIVSDAPVAVRPAPAPAPVAASAPARAPAPSIAPVATPPAASAEPRDAGTTLAPSAPEAARAPARSILPVQPKDSLGAKAAPAGRRGAWARAAVSLALALVAGAGGFFWTARHAAREAAHESAAQVDAVRGAVAENHDRVVGLEGRAASWDRGVERIQGLASTAQQHGDDIDALRAKIARLEGDVGHAHDRQRRLQATLELAAIREQTAWAFPKGRPPSPEPSLAGHGNQPAAADLSKRVHPAKATNPFAPTRPLP